MRVCVRGKLVPRTRSESSLQNAMFRRCFSTSTSALPPTIQQLLSPRASNSIRSKVEVNGWVKSVRRQKRVAFAVITDGSSAEGLQAVFTNTELAKQYVSSTHKSRTRIQKHLPFADLPMVPVYVSVARLRRVPARDKKKSYRLTQQKS